MPTLTMLAYLHRAASLEVSVTPFAKEKAAVNFKLSAALFSKSFSLT